MPVVDASVWVALCHAGDRHHERSKRWLEARLLEGERLTAPTLLPVEVAAAVRRLTGDEGLAEAAASSLGKLEAIELFDLDADRSRRAAAIASATGVRGADAVYLELAAHRRDVLVTWDRQQLERGGTVARVETPSP
ncbi:MAG: type II toxin-antitoxin system VapC family toxin [Thermoanaerobaculia bacterium]